VPVILIAFVVMLSFAAFLPSRHETLLEQRRDAALVPATMMQTWHAAAVRACLAGGSPCGAGSIAPAQILNQLPSYAATTQAAYLGNRFASWSNGSYVFTVYTGAGTARPTESANEAAAALIRITTPDSQTNVGSYRVGSGFVQGSYSTLLAMADGTTRTLSPNVQPIPADPGPYSLAPVPNGAAMLGTRVLINFASTP